MNEFVTDRLRRRIQMDFGPDARAAERLIRAAARNGQRSERVLAAIVRSSNGDLERLVAMVELGHRDWRDALVAGELADEDWRQVLDRELGPATSARGAVLVLAGCVIAGALQWTLWVVGRTGEDAIPLGFWLGTLLVVVLVVLCFDVEPALVGLAVFAAPMVLALWTMPRGDNDGLWLLSVFVLAGAGGLMGALALGVGRVRTRPLLPPIAETHAGWLTLGLLVMAVGTVVLFVDRRADPFPELERVAAGFDLPDEFVGRTFAATGDPLCDVHCGPTVEVAYRFPGSVDDACADMEAWLAESHPRAEQGTLGDCSWRIAVDETDVDVIIDEYNGTRVHITVRPLA